MGIWLLMRLNLFWVANGIKTVSCFKLVSQYRDVMTNSDVTKHVFITQYIIIHFFANNAWLHDAFSCRYIMYRLGLSVLSAWQYV